MNDAKKLSNNINFVKINEHCNQYNNNYLRHTFKKESKDIFIINSNKKSKSRNQSNLPKNKNIINRILICLIIKIIIILNLIFL